MSQQNPNDQFASDVSSIQSSISSLEQKARMTDVITELGKLDSWINAIPHRLMGLRNRGYVFENNLEHQITDIETRWINIRPGVQNRVDLEVNQNGYAIRPIEGQLSYLLSLGQNPAAGAPVIAKLRGDLNTLESKIYAAENAVKGMYAPFQTETKATDDHITWLEWTFTQLDEACFKLLATEACVLAVKATWYRDQKEDKDDPHGILFLTDQRIIFEQNEEVATKKVLFITTEKKKVQQSLFDIPVQQIEAVKGSKKGLFKNEDNLELHFLPGVSFDTTLLHIFDQDCQAWQAIIYQVKNGEIQKNRTAPIEAAVIEKVKSAPGNCPNCAGVLNVPVLRGQDSITCPYCGTIIQL